MGDELTAWDRPAFVKSMLRGAVQARGARVRTSVLMKHWAPLALLVGALCAGAQSISPGRVEGTVLSLTGDPIRKAAVRLEGASENGRTAANYIRTSDD